MNITSPPEGILDPKQPWWPTKNIGERLWIQFKAKLTGIKMPDGTQYSSFVRVSEADADKIIENIKKYGRYPQVNQSGKDGGYSNLEAYQHWVVDNFLNLNAFTEGFTDTSVPADATDEEKEEAVEQEAEEIVQEAEEEVKENVDEAAEVVDEIVEENKVEQVPQDILDDMPDNLKSSLAKLISQRTGVDIPVEKKKSASGPTNSNILRTLVGSLQKIQGTLDSINNELKIQNGLLSGALATTVTNLNQIETSHEGLNAKFDAILGAFQAQTAAQEEALDQAETDAAIAAQKEGSDTAGTFGFDTIDESKVGVPGYIKSWMKKALGQLWKRFAPRKLRAITRLFRSKVTRLLSRFAPRNVARALARKAFGSTAQAGARGVGRFVTRKALQIGGKKLAQTAAVQATQQFVKRAALGLMRPIFGRIPIFGGLIDFAVSLMLGENPGRAAAKAIGATIGAALGTFIPIPIAGTIIGGVVGDLVGGGLYDAITGGSPSEPTGDPQATESGAPTSFADQSGGLGTPDPEPPQQKETGGLTKPGWAIMHGTEAIVPADQYEKGTDNQDLSGKMLSPIGGALIGAASNFLTQAGPAAALVAPMFKQVAGSLTNVFDVPATLAQTNVGGSFAGIDSTLKDAKKKSEDKDSEDNSESRSDYAGEVGDINAPDKSKRNSLLGNLWSGLTSLFGARKTTPYQGDPNFNMPSEFSNVEFGNTDELRFGLTGRTAMAVGGWSHAHFENQDKSQSALIKDTVPVVKKMASMGMKPETSDGRQFTTAMSDKEIGELIKHGSDRHNHSGPKPYAVDINMPGFPLVPVALTDVRNTPSKGEGINALIKGTNTAIFHLSYKTDGYSKGGPVGLNGPEQITVGEEGPEIVMKNLVYEMKPISDMLDAYNASTSTTELIESTRAYAPEILMYDTESDEDDEPIIIIQQAPSAPVAQSSSKTSQVFMTGVKRDATKSMLMQKLLA